jgi:hypothetical protein
MAKLTPEEKKKRRARGKPLKPQQNPKPYAGLNRAINAAALRAKKATVRDAFEAVGMPPVATMEEQELLKEKQLLEATLREEMRELALNDFWFFITHVLFPSVWKDHYLEDFHQPIANILQELKQGENFLFLLPREHRKSYICTIAFSVWLILKDPNIRIQYVGVKESTCKKFATLVRDIFLVKNKRNFPVFQEVFDDYVITKTDGKLQMAEWTHPNRTQALTDSTIFSTYLANPTTGGRADVQIWDDAFDRKNLSSPEMAAKTMEKMGDLLPIAGLTSKYRNRVFIGTRWSYFDPYGKLLGEKGETLGEDLEGKLEKMVKRPRAMVRHCKENPNRLCEHCPPEVLAEFPHGHPDWEEGIPILDPIVTEELLQDRYNEYLLDPARGESLFFHQYLNVCIAPGDRKYQPEWFPQASLPSFPVTKRRVLAIDSADKDMQSEGQGDWMVALFGEFDDEGRLLIRHGIRNRRWTRGELLRQIIGWCEATNWWPQIVAKEKFGQDTFLTDAYNAFRGRFRPVFCVPVTRPRFGQNVMPKLDWIISSTQAPMEQMQVIWGSLVPKEFYERAVYEHVNLGQVAHEDIADCLACFFDPKVRIKAPTRMVMPAQGWQSPDLNLYEPGKPAQGAPPPQAPAGPFDNLKTGGFMVLPQGYYEGETDSSNVRWQPAPVSQPQRVDREGLNQGSGGFQITREGK